MAWQKVMYTHVDRHVATRYYGDDRREIWRYSLQMNCGHTAVVNCNAPPKQIDCMACDEWVQPMLPIPLPVHVRRK